MGMKTYKFKKLTLHEETKQNYNNQKKLNEKEKEKKRSEKEKQLPLTRARDEIINSLREE